MGNKLEKQLYEQDISRVAPILNDICNHCRKGNPKLNWLKVVHGISVRIIPLTAEAIRCIMAEKPHTGAQSAVTKKWQKRLDAMQVTLLLLHKGGFVTLELSAVLQQLPAAHETLVTFLSMWGAYLEDMTVTGAVQKEQVQISQAEVSEGQLSPTALCEAAIDSFIHIVGDWAELDALCSVMLDTERRPQCQLVICNGLARHLGSHASRFEVKALDALAAVLLAVVRTSMRVEDREGLCLAALSCLRPLAGSMADSAGLLLCASRAFASADDCWPAKQATMDCLACHLQAHPATATSHALQPMLIKALEASEPGLGVASVLASGHPPPRTEAVDTARSTLCCIAAIASTPQCNDLLPHIARAALLYTEDCVPDALRCIGAMLEAGPGVLSERELWKALLGVVADTLRVPPLADALPPLLKGALQALEASIPPASKHKPSGTEPLATAMQSPLVSYTMDFYHWDGDRCHCVVPPTLRSACPEAAVAPLQALLSGTVVDAAIKQLCQRIASCLALRISTTDDAATAERTIRLFMEVVHSNDPSRLWRGAGAPFFLHFGKQVCVSLVLQLVTGQRDRYLSALKAEIQQLHAATEQLTVEKEALTTKLEALRRQADSALQLQQAMQCSVCLEALTENRPCALQCGHLFHLPCVVEVFRSGRPGHETCPLCRTPISTPPLLLKGLEE
eukprot:GGOE01001703.1.p1 GENE.GGOE01001703.1~~GGOE01001703.1.p1  ORF type:complete len:682 (-),score=151.04 GGOE01001703.1:247-2292(-)